VAIETLPVTVDRSHLIVIGEKLYARSLELVRELVNNAYDADATEVHVRVTPDAIEPGSFATSRSGCPTSASTRSRHDFVATGSGSSGSASSRRSRRAGGSRC
jgi:hypothetical protein